MVTLTLQDLKSRGSKAIPDDQVSYLIVNSKPKSVLVPPAEYEALIEAWEDLEDIQAIHDRRNEEAVPFETVFPAK